MLDRKVERVRIIASRFGGMEIEEIAKDHPEEILQVVVEPAVGLQSFEARELAFGLGLNLKQVSRAVATMLGCYRAFRDLDATMVEINPLVVTKDDRVLALDAKMSFDDNALFRRGNVSDMRDHSQEDPREVQAAEHNLNYVGLDGDIGCIVNGAGLAMATMDMIKYAGGAPANFLDVGGGASPERVAAAFRLVLSDRNVKAILVNVFAGINRCDWVAEGVVQACRSLECRRAADRAARRHQFRGRTRHHRQQRPADHQRRHARRSRPRGGRRRRGRAGPGDRLSPLTSSGLSIANPAERVRRKRLQESQ